MITSINKPVTVFTLFSPSHQCSPYKIIWKTYTYTIKKKAFHHTLYKGTILYHIFSLSTGSLDMILSFNTKTLVWILEEISDATSY